MRVLILGGRGMLGHKAYQVLREDFDVYTTIRSSFSEVERFGVFDRSKTICNVNVLDLPNLEAIIGELKPDVILNCIGIVKQINEANDAVKSIEINSLFPHRLAGLCGKINSRLIHMSTDCVFSGKKGGYTEDDNPDPLDLYGRTKLLGEVTEGNVLILRTSIIGRELNTKHGLLEWFFSQRGKTIKGYTKAIFSGFTTGILSVILKDIILNHMSIKGLYHVSSGSISKFDLLMSIKKKFDLNVEIIPDDQFKCDRSLDSSKFRIEAGYIPPLWDTMIGELAGEIKKEAI